MGRRTTVSLFGTIFVLGKATPGLQIVVLHARPRGLNLKGRQSEAIMKRIIVFLVHHIELHGL